VQTQFEATRVGFSYVGKLLFYRVSVLACLFAGLAFDLVFREHGAAALGGFAVAVGGVVVGVIEVVLVDELLVGGDIADGTNVDAALVLLSAAVGVAGVVEEHGGAEAVDDLALVTEAEEVGDGALGIALVSKLFGNARAVVLEDAAAAGDGVEGIAAGGVDGGGSNEEAGRGEGATQHGVEYSKGR
jgi:hypothetical protein